MKKILGYLVMVCCISAARGQGWIRCISLEKAIKILKSKGVFKEVVYDPKIDEMGHARKYTTVTGK